MGTESRDPGEEAGAVAMKLPKRKSRSGLCVVHNRMAHYDPTAPNRRQVIRTLKTADGTPAAEISYDTSIGAVSGKDMVAFYGLVAHAQKHNLHRISFKSKASFERITGLKFANNKRLIETLRRLMHTEISFVERNRNGSIKGYDLCILIHRLRYRNGILTVHLDKEALHWLSLQHSTTVDYLKMDSLPTDLARKWYLKMQTFKSRLNTHPIKLDLQKVSELFGVIGDGDKMRRPGDLFSRHEQAIEQAFPISDLKKSGDTGWVVTGKYKTGRGKYIIELSKIRYGE